MEEDLITWVHIYREKITKDVSNDIATHFVIPYGKTETNMEKKTYTSTYELEIPFSFTPKDGKDVRVKKLVVTGKLATFNKGTRFEHTEKRTKVLTIYDTNGNEVSLENFQDVDEMFLFLDVLDNDIFYNK